MLGGTLDTRQALTGLLGGGDERRQKPDDIFAGRYRQYRRGFPAGPVRVVIRVTRDNGSFARADIDYLDAEGQLVAQVQDYECVIDRQLDQAFRRNQLAPKAKA